jgi:hypothetical protein
MRGVELVDVEIGGELQNVVNGVDIAPPVDAELNRRMPERARMRPDDIDGFREAGAILERLWEGTNARARTFPEAALHRSARRATGTRLASGSSKTSSGARLASAGASATGPAGRRTGFRHGA